MSVTVELLIPSLLGRIRAGRIFFITVSLTDLFSRVREDFVDNFEDLASYCSNVESSHSSGIMFHHLHVFLEFREKFFVDDLRKWVDVFLNSGEQKIHFDIQPCRSRKSCLRYITKEDHHAVTNIKESDLPFYFRAYKWAMRTQRFRYDDPFVVEHRFCYNFLRHMYFDVQCSKNSFKRLNFKYKCVSCNNFGHKQIYFTGNRNQEY